MNGMRLSDIIGWIGGMDLSAILAAAAFVVLLVLLLALWRARDSGRDANEQRTVE